MKRVIFTLIGIVIISFALLIGINLIGSPFPIVVEEHSVIPGEREVKYHEGDHSLLQLIWWND
ncbi:hypothetical protein ASD24_03570 [Paenibacillus sp. Root52]|uniref:Uncharacterized protein n=1 Tax=Paenibacillus amylolyticus TaxID=1451 RepID=A0AAP5H7B1_PAEAM|nr:MULTISPECIES: hypothetical protein [Paenibacillus]KQY94638.1 hypothetical protein ASD24_03570 [Paenibacillus sp. Root52]MDR6726386.1 hypothetical protein [Paenibacillus amylolyticus]